MMKNDVIDKKEKPSFVIKVYVEWERQVGK